PSAGFSPAIRGVSSDMTRWSGIVVLIDMGCRSHGRATPSGRWWGGVTTRDRSRHDDRPPHSGTRRRILPVNRTGVAVTALRRPRRHARRRAGGVDPGRLERRLGPRHRDVRGARRDARRDRRDQPTARRRRRLPSRGGFPRRGLRRRGRSLMPRALKLLAYVLTAIVVAGGAVALGGASIHDALGVLAW